MEIKEQEIRDEFGSIANYLKQKGFKIWAMRVLKEKKSLMFNGTSSEAFRLKEQLKRDGFLKMPTTEEVA